MKRQFTLCLGLALLGVGLHARAANLGSELLLNGDAEAGDTRGWVSTGIGVLASDGVSPGSLGLPAGTSLGKFVFTGGTGAATGQGLTQAIDLTDWAGAIDAGTLSASFSILVQSRIGSGATDTGSGALRFVDAAGGLLASFTFVDPPSTTFDWQLFADSRPVPVGTRSFEAVLLAKRNGGVSSDTYFDNASLVLTQAVPEPAIAWLMLAGLPLLVWRRRGSGQHHVNAAQA